MNTKRIKSFIRWFSARRVDGDVTPGSNKAIFKRETKYLLKCFAEDLGLTKDQYDLRFNAGGPAVSGETILHTDNFYIMIHDGCMGKDQCVLYRSCFGRRDYRGGINNFTNLESFLNTNSRLYMLIKKYIHELSPILVAEDWMASQNLEIPIRFSSEWKKLYEKWINYAFEPFSAR